MARLEVTELEDRTVPYALSGYAWDHTALTYSLVPDGAIGPDGLPSGLFAHLDQTIPRDVWVAEIDRALAAWADVSGVWFTKVEDSFAVDVRVYGGPLAPFYGRGTYPLFGGAQGGDVGVSTSVAWNVPGGPDLFSVVLHEAGHALGLAHSELPPDEAVMNSLPLTVHDGLLPDDVSGIQALYGLDVSLCFHGGKHMKPKTHGRCHGR